MICAVTYFEWRMIAITETNKICRILWLVKVVKNDVTVFQQWRLMALEREMNTF